MLLGRKVLARDIELIKPPKHVQADISTNACFRFSKELSTTPGELNHLVVGIMNLLIKAKDKRVNFLKDVSES